MSGSGICATRKNQSRSRAATRDGGARLGRLPSARSPALSFSLARLLIGRPIANEDAEDTKLGVIAGVPSMGLDGLGSASYGPEAALTILAGTGAAGLGLIGPITWAILVLLTILASSYWQTIAAYPTNGGSYVVAKENLGTNAGLLAAAALMVDYMLNVAVGISAGIGALTSAIPALQPYTLVLCLAILVLLTVINLRGTRESGLAWAVPTYLFIASLGIILIWGVVRTATRTRRPGDPARRPAAGDRARRHLAHPACLRERVHRHDRRRGGQQRRRRLPRAAA